MGISKIRSVDSVATVPLTTRGRCGSAGELRRVRTTASGKEPSALVTVSMATEEPRVVWGRPGAISPIF